MGHEGGQPQGSLFVDHALWRFTGAEMSGRGAVPAVKALERLRGVESDLPGWEESTR